MAATHTSPATTGIYEEADRCWRLLTPHANVPEATSATSDGHATEVKQMSTSLRCDPSPTEEPLTHQKLLSLRVLWPAEVDRICDNDTRVQFLVDGFLPAKSIGIAAGDSTIGKSPLAYQLGLCVAAGVPFLGRSTKQGRVVYFDLENSIHDSRAIRDALARFLGLSVAPENFLLATEPPLALETLIAEVKPSLVIIDSLRAFAPEATRDNPAAAAWLNALRRLARKHGVCFVIVHHVRKPKDAGTHCDLTSRKVSEWMLEMEGPRALVNQTDVRIALEPGNGEPAALGMKWSRRVYGDSPLVLLERVFDDDGEPAGYRQATGINLLSPERRAAFEKLSAEFRYTDAKQALNRGAASTVNFLTECVQLGIAVPVEKGYRKTATTDEAGSWVVS
jgi:archaellum biogenesis ATPase FlaH